jgi:hypothetical protein
MFKTQLTNVVSQTRKVVYIHLYVGSHLKFLLSFYDKSCMGRILSMGCSWNIFIECGRGPMMAYFEPKVVALMDLLTCVCV